MTLLGAIVTPINPTACLFFGYAGACVGFLGRQSWSLAAIVVIAAVIGFEALMLDLGIGFWAVNTLVVVTLGGVCIHWSEINKANAELMRKQSEIERLAKIAERERIARDLHDLLGHTLSVSVLKARLAAKLIRRDANAAEKEINEIERISREALGQVREAVQGYRNAGLAEELDNARSALNTANVDSQFSIDDEAAKTPSQIENVLAMALREAVTNVIRHAGGTRCRVELSTQDQNVVLQIVDNGSGGAIVPGAGLNGMRERVESLGGSIDVDGTSMSGTILKVRIPMVTQPKSVDSRSVQDVA
jgi:two-component system sensor histidine kinase DesK